MIGLDANVLIRYLAGDEPIQSQQARHLLESLTADEPGYLSLVALVETLWVLKHHYHTPRDQVLSVVSGLLEVPSLVFQCADEVRQAIQLSLRHSIDLPDALLRRLDAAAGCAVTVTFDRRAARLPGMRQVSGDVTPPPA